MEKPALAGFLFYINDALARQIFAANLCKINACFNLNDVIK